jgi:NTP pyrophosphatase (non-canonical NTP hydrolase)
MNFDEYQHEALKTADYPKMGGNLIYPALGLAGEAGEVTDKIKKYWRNFGIKSGGQLTDEQRHLIALEVSDVLWYCSAMAFELNMSLDDIAQLNLKKLKDRQQRGVIKSEGDLR